MFNDPIAVEEFYQLVRRFDIELLVETGTNTGYGSLAAASLVPVVTMEVNADYRNQALKVFSNNPHPHPIVSLLGNSPELLWKMNFSGRCCFYLDAHWQEYWPLQDELRAIAAMNKPDSVLIIHDCKVPGKPWGFDTYQGQELTLEYVRDGLKLINPSYETYYNENAEGNMRGILYAVPPLRPESIGPSVTP